MKFKYAHLVQLTLTVGLRKNQKVTAFAHKLLAVPSYIYKYNKHRRYTVHSNVNTCFWNVFKICLRLLIEGSDLS